MPELDAQHRAQLAETLHEVACGCKDGAEPGDVAYQTADALAPLVAEWLADAWDEGYRLDWTGGVKWRNPYRGGDS